MQLELFNEIMVGDRICHKLFKATKGTVVKCYNDYILLHVDNTPSVETYTWYRSSCVLIK